MPDMGLSQRRIVPIGVLVFVISIWPSLTNLIVYSLNNFNQRRNVVLLVARLSTIYIFIIRSRQIRSLYATLKINVKILAPRAA